MPFNIGPGELILVLIIALIVVGPGKLPDVGAAIGKSLREFRRAASDVSESANPPAAPGPTAPPMSPPAVTPPPPAATSSDPIADNPPSGSAGQRQAS